MSRETKDQTTRSRSRAAESGASFSSDEGDAVAPPSDRAGSLGAPASGREVASTSAEAFIENTTLVTEDMMYAGSAVLGGYDPDFDKMGEVVSSIYRAMLREWLRGR